MRVLGIDLGDRRIGLAVSDKLLFTAQALGFYQPENKEKDKKYFIDLVSRYEVSKIVLGLPLRMNGTSGTRAQKTQEFAQWLEKTVNLPVVLWDERLTTKQTLRILSEQKISPKKKKAIKDQISAVIILSCYLESQR